MTMTGVSLADDRSIVKKLELLGLDTKALDDNETSNAPIFTESVRQHVNGVFSQYGLLGGEVSKLKGVQDVPSAKTAMPFVHFNVKTPSSAFICGSQGSGKSHTMNCILENCLIPSDANTLPQPLTGIVFHFDPFVSDTGGQPCEAAFLSSHPDVDVRVLCAPTNVRQIKALYSTLPNVHVQELRLGQKDLNTKRMLDLMAVSSVQGGGMPLYFHVVTRVLRDLRIEQQKFGGNFQYAAFKRALDSTELNPGQRVPLDQRLDTLESFMATEDVGSGNSSNKKKKGVVTATAWQPKAGQLTIVDLSCPCVTADAACSLFNICLNLFLEQQQHVDGPADASGAGVGRVIALDEAHKYMTDSPESAALTESLLSAIRLQRHLGTRVVIATQEPTISPKLLDLCSISIVHRFTSPDWLATLQGHLAGATPGLAAGGNGDRKVAMADLLGRIVALRQGEALLFCPSALVGVVEDRSAGEVKQDGIKEDGVKEEEDDDDDDEDEDDDDDEDDDEDEDDDGKEDPASAELVPLRQGFMHIRVRRRITQDGGRSIMAG